VNQSQQPQQFILAAVIMIVLFLFFVFVMILNGNKTVCSEKQMLYSMAIRNAKTNSATLPSEAKFFENVQDEYNILAFKLNARRPVYGHHGHHR
jgi:hypothetical protein